MKIIIEFFKFIIYSGLIVVISKYALVPVLRKLAESLNLKPKTVGSISGVATSVPELLTVSFSALTGLLSASTYNIISSNVINTIQYLTSIFLNKNQRHLQNKAIKIDLIMVALTVLIPIIILIIDIPISLSIVPVFLLLFFLFYFINGNTHKLYLNKKTRQDIEIEEEMRWSKKGTKAIIKYIFLLLIISILLYFIGNLLSYTLEDLCIQFNIPQIIIGILLGFITSIPELITFFESQKHHKKQTNEEDGVIEATNNLLTSNTLNLFIIQTVGIIIFYVVSKLG